MLIDDSGPYVSVEEAAKFFRVNRRTIARWVQDGTLPGYRVGPRLVRIRRADLEAMVAPIKDGA